MKKYKCTNMECRYSCELRTDVFPHKCVNWDYIPTWVELGETEPVTECNQLPKLTAEVFDHPDCPAWAKWAAVCEDGMVRVFRNIPQHTAHNYWFDPWSYSEWYLKGDKYDATDWQNSLIEKPAKKPELPDWCKVGEWIYSDGGKDKYAKITFVREDEIVAGKNGTYSAGFIKNGNVLPARLRPYNADEMKALVGKVLVHPQGNYLITFFSKALICVKAAESLCNPDELLEHWTQLDGQPCGKLEHLENGEWVE